MALQWRVGGTHSKTYNEVLVRTATCTRWRELLHEDIKHVQAPAGFLADAPQAVPKPKESLQAAPQAAPKPKESPQAILLIIENIIIIFFLI